MITGNVVGWVGGSIFGALVFTSFVFLIWQLVNWKKRRELIKLSKRIKYYDSEYDKLNYKKIGVRKKVAGKKNKKKVVNKKGYFENVGDMHIDERRDYNFIRKIREKVLKIKMDVSSFLKPRKNNLELNEVFFKEKDSILKKSGVKNK